MTRALHNLVIFAQGEKSELLDGIECVQGKESGKKTYDGDKGVEL